MGRPNSSHESSADSYNTQTFGRRTGFSNLNSRAKYYAHFLSLSIKGSFSLLSLSSACDTLQYTYIMSPFNVEKYVPTINVISFPFLKLTSKQYANYRMLQSILRVSDLSTISAKRIRHALAQEFPDDEIALNKVPFPPFPAYPIQLLINQVNPR